MSESGALARLAERYPQDDVQVAPFSADVYETMVLGRSAQREWDEHDLYDVSFALTQRVAQRFDDLGELIRERPEQLGDPWFRGLVNRLTTPNGVLGIPWRSSSYILTYRADFAEKLDLSPPDTITKAIHFAQVAQERLGVFGYAAAQRGALHQAMDWLPFLWGFGGDVIQDGRVVLNSSEAVRALGAYVELNATGAWQAFEFEYADTNEALLDGAAAMAQHWMPEAAALLRRAPDPGKFRFLPGLGAPVRGGGGLAIAHGAARREPSLAFLRWLLDPEVDFERVRLGGSPIYSSTTARIEDRKLSELLHAGLAAANKARDRPSHHEWPAIQRVLARVARDAQMGKADHRRLIAEADEEIRGIISAYDAAS